jgi:hypothetical protein
MRASWLAILGIAVGVAAYAAGGKKALMVPVAEVKFAEAFPDHPGGPQVGLLYGDLKKGASGFLLKIPAGFKAPPHSHSADYKTVAISGTFLHGEVGDAPPKPVTAGSYWYQPAKVPHTDECAPGADCLAFVQFAGPFDFVPAATAAAGGKAK